MGDSSGGEAIKSFARECMESYSKKPSECIVVTGGCGFIGSNFLHYMIKKYPHYNFINVDKLSYSGRMENTADLEGKSNYKFFKEDICNHEKMLEIIPENSIVVNFAAESHVDNSILEPAVFIKNNVLGTHSVLDAARKKNAKLFVQISTDEVYGSLGFEAESSKEHHLLNPSSPYSASKAAAEMVCIGNVKTFKQPVIITRSSNNFGPNQFPEKVIPLFATNLIEGLKVPLYGTGLNVRDWIFVLDNCSGIDFVIHNGKIGEIYNIGGGNEVPNIELTKLIVKQMGKDEDFINYVEDRKAHDLRYSLDCSKLKALGWKPEFAFDDALAYTLGWYKENKQWWEPLKNTEGKRTR